MFKWTDNVSQKNIIVRVINKHIVMIFPDVIIIVQNLNVNVTHINTFTVHQVNIMIAQYVINMTKILYLNLEMNAGIETNVQKKNILIMDNIVNVIMVMNIRAMIV